MKKQINILIVDDSIMFGEGLTELLSQNVMINSITQVTNEKEAYASLSDKNIDIVLLDLNFDTIDFDGFAIAKKIKEKYPDIKIIIITQHAKIDHYETLIHKIGVHAYLDKRLSIRQLDIAIKSVINNTTYIDPSLQKMMDIGRWLKISPREKEVIELLRKGDSQKIIADKLCIDIKTVESHLRNVRERYGFKNSVELINEYTNYKNAYREDYKNTISPFRK